MIRMFRTLLRSRDGNISILFALALPLVIGVVALVAEFGRGLLERAENQRVADLAAFSGALAYNASSSTSTMTDAANRVASLNGIPSSKVTASLVSSPKTPANQAVTVRIATSRDLLLAPVLNGQSSLPIKADAYVELGGSTPACIIALSGSETGVTLSGGTSISAPSCAVASNNTVTVPCGTSITTPALNYNSSSAPSIGCTNGVVAPSGKTLQIKKIATTDPLIGNSGVSTGIARLATVAAYTSPAAPTVSVTATTVDISFPYWNDTSYFTGKLPAGCAAAYGTAWSINCAAGGTYNFGAVTIQNGTALNITGTSANPTVFNFKNTLTVNNGTFTFPGGATFNLLKGLTVTGGSTATFGTGTYNIKEGITTGGGTTTTFGAGTFNIGASTASCSGATYSICHTGTTMTFAGPSTFTLQSGIYNKGGSTLTLGNGSSANSYNIGGSSGGNALYLGGGSKTTFGDAVGTTFKLAGNLNVASGGGSCLTLPAADYQDIKGYMSTAGGTIMGSGTYTVTGYIALGANGGGNVTCNGNSVGLSGTNVTFVAGAASTLSSGTCSGTAFCVAAGYSDVTLTAPASGTMSKLLVIGPSSGGTNTAGATFAQGAAASLSGVFYFPKGPINLGGGASVSNGTGSCLQIIGSRVTLTGGTSAASACITTSSSGGSVVLVQ
jgi:Flp pilus assembly protein TadG